MKAMYSFLDAMYSAEAVLAWDFITTITTIEESFDRNFNSATKVVEFNPEWDKRAGHTDTSVGGEPDLMPDEVAKCVSPDGRKIIFVNTKFGICVVFQRYAGNSDELVTNYKRLVDSVKHIKKDMLRYYEDLGIAAEGSYPGKLANADKIIASTLKYLESGE
jgi:hypothetical protein